MSGSDLLIKKLVESIEKANETDKEKNTEIKNRITKTLNKKVEIY